MSGELGAARLTVRGRALALALLVGIFACGPTRLPPVPPVAVQASSAPSQARAALLRARLRLEAGDLAAATTEAERALRLDPAAAAPWVLLADVAAASGHPDAENAAIDEALQREPAVAALRRRRVAAGRGTADDLAFLRADASPWSTAEVVAVAAAVSAADPLADVLAAEARRAVWSAQGDALVAVCGLLDPARMPFAVLVAATRTHDPRLAPSADIAWRTVGRPAAMGAAVSAPSAAGAHPAWALALAGDIAAGLRWRPATMAQEDIEVLWLLQHANRGADFDESKAE